MSRPIVTLLTDFGHRDSFVGQVKGVILGLCPDARLVDLAHEVPPHDVSAGSYLLESGYGAFPRGTVHLAVVDPGVGTERPVLAVRAGGHRFVAPDNGLLDRVLSREPIEEARWIENPELRRTPYGATFEARDRLAPAAAWLARGEPLERLGRVCSPLPGRPFSRPRIESGLPVELVVLHVDRFGNVVLDLRASEWEAAGAGPPRSHRPFELQTPGETVRRLLRTYGDAEIDEPFLLVNSSGYLEVALRAAPAAERLRLRPGSKVRFVLDG